MTHALIVGPRGVGKTTLINHVLQELDRPVYGFQSKKEVTLTDEKRRDPVYIYEPGKARVQSDDNLLGYCAPEGFHVVNNAFNHYAPKILAPMPTDAVIVFDELGFMESGEKAFCEAVLSRLDGDIPVIAAVKHNKDIPFLDTVRTHPKCRCFAINEENREKLFEEVLAFMREQIASRPVTEERNEK